jgi:hypothetical protein
LGCVRIGLPQGKTRWPVHLLLFGLEDDSVSISESESDDESANSESSDTGSPETSAAGHDQELSSSVDDVNPKLANNDIVSSSEGATPDSSSYIGIDESFIGLVLREVDGTVSPQRFSRLGIFEWSGSSNDEERG